MDTVLFYLVLGFSAVIPIYVRRIVVSEVQSAVDAVAAQLVKARDEIVAAIEDLRAREPEVDLSALVSAAQSLDDVVPDAPVEAEVPSE